MEQSLSSALCSTSGSEGQAGRAAGLAARALGREPGEERNGEQQCVRATEAWGGGRLRPNREKPCRAWQGPGLLLVHACLCVGPPHRFLLPSQGPRAWEWRYYKFRVRVFSPASAKIEEFEATDPYSRSLAADGARSQARPLHRGSGARALARAPCKHANACGCCSRLCLQRPRRDLRHPAAARCARVPRHRPSPRAYAAVTAASPHAREHVHIYEIHNARAAAPRRRPNFFGTLAVRVPTPVCQKVPLTARSDAACDCACLRGAAAHALWISCVWPRSGA